MKKTTPTPKRKWARYARALTFKAYRQQPATWTITHYARCKSQDHGVFDAWKDR